MSAAPADSLYFSEHFRVPAEALQAYGAFDISVVTDLPLFIDPFLLFHSAKPEYQALHQGIVDYLQFLRSRADAGLDRDTARNLYRFREVKQNWLGFAAFGNEGQPLGQRFAEVLHESLDSLLPSPGDVARSTHLEKLLLLRTGIGRDSISDFTTNLIKHFLLDYTQTFAREHLDPKVCTPFNVLRAVFNPDKGAWESRRYTLPNLRDDYVLLTPADLLTREDTWINYPDMVRKFPAITDAIEHDDLRAQVDKRLRKLLPPKAKTKPTPKQRAEAAAEVLRALPQLADVYLRLKEDTGDEAVALSAARTSETAEVLVERVKRVAADLEAKTDFYRLPWASYDECLARARVLKAYVERSGGGALLRGEGERPLREVDFALFFALVWCRTDFDVNRERDDERAAVDFKASYGAGATSLVEFKLARSAGLKRTLEKAARAGGRESAVTILVCYSADERDKVSAVLSELGLAGAESVVVLDLSA